MNATRTTVLVPFNLTRLMRAHKVTIRDLAKRTGLTMERIRLIRAADMVPYTTYCDLHQAVTGENVFSRARHDAMA